MATCAQQDTFAEASSDTFRLSATDPAAFRALLDWLYTGDLSPLHNDPELALEARKLQPIVVLLLCDSAVECQSPARCGPY